MENINKDNITRAELAEIIEGEVDEKIKSGDIDMDAVAEIAEELKDKGLFTAGDELRNKAEEIWRQRLINEELEKRFVN
jgi:hypothetical protein